jgi:hypothetical protein
MITKRFQPNRTQITSAGVVAKVSGSEGCMKEYVYSPKENLTHEELVAIVGYMIGYSTFNEAPFGAERHFRAIGNDDPKKEPSFKDRVTGWFNL